MSPLVAPAGAKQMPQQLISPPSTKDLLEYAKEIAIEAGKILQEGFQLKNKLVDCKNQDQTDLVTEFDKRTEAFIGTKIAEKYPSHR